VRAKFKTAPSKLGVWAVESRALQITWGELPAGNVRARAGEVQVTTEHLGGPGAIELTGLRPGTKYQIRVTVEPIEGDASTHTFDGTTLAHPGGQELCRIATISDLHIGTDHFGFNRTMRESGEPDEVFSVRCARSAMAAAQDWGADLLIIKGDAVHHRLTAHYALLADLVDEFPDLEMVLLPGNHDVDTRSTVPLPDVLGARKLQFETDPRARELPGITLLTADTSVPGKGSGSIEPTSEALLELGAKAHKQSGGVMLACHHQFQQYRFATHWPPGITGHQARPFLKDFDAVAPRSFVTSGHTHRCRAYQRHSLQVTEVSSTSDFPGSWAGYVVSEGGLTQTVRRIVTPSEMAWLEYSKGAIFGIWGKWSPGSLEDRCLNHSWAGSH
jgi:hypothetical protein